MARPNDKNIALRADVGHDSQRDDRISPEAEVVGVAV